MNKSWLAPRSSTGVEPLPNAPLVTMSVTIPAPGCRADA